MAIFAIIFGALVAFVGAVSAFTASVHFLQRKKWAPAIVLALVGILLFAGILTWMIHGLNDVAELCYL